MDRRLSSHRQNAASTLTANEVANLLRSSIRRGVNQHRHQSSLPSNVATVAPTQDPPNAASIENLVEAAAPIGQETIEQDLKKTVPEGPVTVI